MYPVHIVAMVFLAAGFAVTMLSKKLMIRLGLDKRPMQIPEGLTDEETESYRQMKASVTVKTIGLLLALPGVVLFLAFR